jgi:hypothetical protein
MKGIFKIFYIILFIYTSVTTKDDNSGNIFTENRYENNGVGSPNKLVNENKYPSQFEKLYEFHPQRNNVYTGFVPFMNSSPTYSTINMPIQQFNHGYVNNLNGGYIDINNIKTPFPQVTSEPPEFYMDTSKIDYNLIRQGLLQSKEISQKLNFINKSKNNCICSENVNNAYKYIIFILGHILRLR